MVLFGIIIIWLSALRFVFSHYLFLSRSHGCWWIETIKVYATATIPRYVSIHWTSRISDGGGRPSPAASPKQPALPRRRRPKTSWTSFSRSPRRRTRLGASTAVWWSLGRCRELRPGVPRRDVTWHLASTAHLPPFRKSLSWTSAADLSLGLLWVI